MKTITAETLDCVLSVLVNEKIQAEESNSNGINDAYLKNINNALDEFKQIKNDISADGEISIEDGFGNVKRGKWLLERHPDGTPYCLHCSVCDPDFKRVDIKTATPFCPHCGSIMENN